MTKRINGAVLSDIMKVVSNRSSILGFKASLVIHIGEEKDIVPYSISIVSIERDYTTQNFDQIEVTALLPLGETIHEMFPNRDILEATLTLQYASMTGETVDRDLVNNVRRYKVILPNMVNEQANANSRYSAEKEAGNKIGFQETNLILVDSNKDQILHTTVSTIPRRTTSGNAVQSILTTVFNNLGLPMDSGINGVNMAPGADTTIQECIIIPQLLEILALPRYLQEKECGIYPGGIGTFIQDNTCYVYPPYDTDQVNKGADTLTVLNLPPDIYPGVESTWVSYEDNFYIMSTDTSMFVDASDIEQSSLGSGIHYLDADALLRAGYTINPGSITLDDKKNLVKSFITNRRNKFNFATHGTKLITSNHMNENSQLAMRNGSMARISWENSKIDIVKPGMAVRVLTIRDMRVAEYHGVVQRIIHGIVPKTVNLTDQFFAVNSKLDVFLTPDPINEYALE